MGETTTQAVTPLDGDIVEVLRTWPSVWTDVDFDRQSALRDTTVAHLVSAGLLQARHTWIWTFQPPSAATNPNVETEEVEFIIDVCGEGWTEWLQELWPRICPPHWFNGTTAQGHYDGSITAVKLRLSEQGESAKRDIEAGDQYQVVDFILRRGRYADRLKTNRKVNVLSVTRKPNHVGWPRQSTDAIRGEAIGPTPPPEIAPQEVQEITPPGVKNEAPRQELADRFVKAYQSYKAAEQELLSRGADTVTDRQAWEHLNEQGFDGYEQDGFKPPPFERWQRYLRDGRRFHDDRKNTPRGGREGGSMVRSDETDTLKPDDGE